MDDMDLQVTKMFCNHNYKKGTLFPNYNISVRVINYTVVEVAEEYPDTQARADREKHLLEKLR